ncbi:MAG: hypothetical protein HZB53_15765 [Chloroflexi bacterium]|nr:hypothetical protein [Chloroflexota bacterium]
MIAQFAARSGPALRRPDHGSAVSRHTVEHAPDLPRPYGERASAVEDEGIQDLFAKIEEMLQRIQEMKATSTEAEEEIPEVFDLKPLISRRVRVRILRVERSPFVFVDDPDALDDELD